MDMRFKLLILAGEATEGYNKANNKAKRELNTKQKKKKDSSVKYDFLKVGLSSFKKLFFIYFNGSP